ncbi:MAG TPA: RNA polymerase sigma factor [Polyangia bacterium]|jgi:RNA polymerase sigma-70 factor (ECF subfamily)
MLVRHRGAVGGPDSDAILVQRARAGDATASAELFRRHASRITALLVRLLGSHADAEDAAQETFVHALRDLHQLRDPRALSQWLTQLAVSQAHRRFRRRRLLAALGFEASPRDGTLDQIADPKASADVRAELALLDQALGELRASQRMAWMLRYVEGYRLAEVARLCGCSLATTKRRLSAASARVAQHIAIEVDDE